MTRKPSCAVSDLTKGTVTCDREQYAFGLCRAHYGQRRRHKPLTAIQERNSGHVSLGVRVRETTRDQMILAAAEQGITLYDLHQQLLEAWAEKRIKGRAQEARSER